MARTVKPEAVAAKRKEILDAFQRLLFTKGYEQMSIQDVLKEINISSGAFHHYFASRGALLDAFIERIRIETEKPILPIIQDPHLNAIEKFQRFFDAFDQLRRDRIDDVISLGRVWYSDTNAIVRLRVEEAIFQQRTPLVAEIVRQGVQEGTFNSIDPDNTGKVILSLLQGMGTIHARLMLALGQPHSDDQPIVDEIIAIYEAYMGAIERTLGAPARSLTRIDTETINFWVAAARDGQ
ncbi:TetR/AcrR family transcriptional regulator [Ktedonospora formicarum]|uniref:HTH tetR-type domain-containing protein n=1 Tax=Ktedonospora formicarum TaxID=2778364 RepID=A0A8J3MRM1_9CHLR|nr:TetR/AcrR family transcriptional regulator [Ktedonospora formicarum]GHO46227.1 hypothetical protein KSX_43900 [Ktedonospora formicarum]